MSPTLPLTSNLFKGTLGNFLEIGRFSKMKILCVFAVISFCTLASGESTSSSEESYHVRVEEHKMVSENGKSREETYVSERKKENGKNESSSSQTTEVIRFPNGTIERKVMNNGGMKPECASNEQCGKGQYCNKLTHQCKDCVQQFGCFNDNQCCNGASCIMGTCQKRSGDKDAPCSKSSECNSGLHCIQGFFNRVCKPFKEVKLGDGCQKQLLGPDLVCQDGLECRPVTGNMFFPKYKCAKKGEVEDKPAWQYGSMWGWKPSALDD